MFWQPSTRLLPAHTLHLFCRGTRAAWGWCCQRATAWALPGAGPALHSWHSMTFSCSLPADRLGSHWRDARRVDGDLLLIICLPSVCLQLPPEAGGPEQPTNTRDKVWLRRRLLMAQGISLERAKELAEGMRGAPAAWLVCLKPLS